MEKLISNYERERAGKELIRLIKKLIKTDDIGMVQKATITMEVNKPLILEVKLAM